MMQIKYNKLRSQIDLNSSRTNQNISYKTNYVDLTKYSI